jgi:hypothetical protein
VSTSHPNNPKGYQTTRWLVPLLLVESLRFNLRKPLAKPLLKRWKALFSEGRKLANAYASPDSFRDMEPLFLAVICGCNAWMFRKALHEVYIPRIQRGNTSFSSEPEKRCFWF